MMNALFGLTFLERLFMSDDSNAQSRLNNALFISAEKSKQLAAAAQGAALLGNARLSEELRSKKLESEATRKIRELEREIRDLRDSLDKERKAFLDWKHSHEAFRYLAKKYKDELGKTQVSYEDELDSFRVNLAEEDVRFKETSVYADAIKRQKSR